MHLQNKLKISTWNVCLGIANKKDIVTETLSREKVDVCCLQETEIPINFPKRILNCNGYNLKLEMNSTKKRVGIYIKNGVNYTRRSDLELENYHVVIIDKHSTRPLRLINLYRSFRPLDTTPGMFLMRSFKLLVVP